MERKWTYWGAGMSIGILALVLGVSDQGRTIGDTSGPPALTCPHYLQVGSQYQVEIVSMSFTNRIESLMYMHQIPEAAAEQYRFAVVTLKITKPAGTDFTLAAADLTLHYYHGDEKEVAPCEGLSWFKGDASAHVPILMNPIPGPGFIKQTTGPADTNRTVLYVDAVFGFMEPDTTACWICLGQPATSAPFVCPSPAWTNGDTVPETSLEPTLPTA